MSSIAHSLMKEESPGFYPGECQVSGMYLLFLTSREPLLTSLNGMRRVMVDLANCLHYLCQ